MSRAARALFAVLALSAPAAAESDRRPADVSHPLNTLLINRHAAARNVTRALKGPNRVNELVLQDRGEIAIVDDGDGVGLPAFPFDLDFKTVSYLPADAAANGYRYQTREQGYNTEAAGGGDLLALDDDDSVELVLGFAFPYFGQVYSSVFVNSDGNLTFGAGDAATTARDPARAVSGPPRISGFFLDLDPTQPHAAIRAWSGPQQFTATWINTPEWQPGGGGRRQNFQISLFADGRIELAYRDITLDFGTIGIASGENLSHSQAVDFSEPNDAVFSAAVVEIFLPADLNLGAIGQKFYLSHQDAYDFLVVFHNYDVGLDTSAFAFYRGVRNFDQGIGPYPAGFEDQNIFDFGELLGSGFRLQGMLFMGDLAKYPADPFERIDRDEGVLLNTPLTVLTHEAGHRFLANVFFVDPRTGFFSLELLGRQLAHWSYFFNSEGSFLEGNRIVDSGAGPFRFETTETAARFSPLDMYLMGLIPPEQVPPSFLVRGPDIASEAFSPATAPIAGILFDGERQDILIEDITRAMGRRRPDHTISQRSFRYGFVLLVQEGTEPSAEEIAKLDRLRREFETFFEEKTAGRIDVETELVQQLTLSTWPAWGLLKGRSTEAAVFLGARTHTPVEVRLSSSDGRTSAPAAVTIPAGEQGVVFPLEAVAGGVDTLRAAIDDSYETAESKIQVLPDFRRLASQRLLIFELLFGDPRERLKTGMAARPLPYSLYIQVRDDNGLPYEGVPVTFRASGDGFTTPSNPISDDFGLAVVDWTLATTPGLNTLRVEIEGSDQPPLTIEAVGALVPRRQRNDRRDLFGL